MRASLAIFSFLFVAGCVAAALAAEGIDRLVLNDGSILHGELLEARQGKFWFTTTDGTVLQVPFEDVAKVERGSQPLASPQPEASPQPDPSTSYEERVAELDDGGSNIGGGFYLGSVSGGRLRFHIENVAVNHVDIKLAVGPFIDYTASVYPVLAVGAEVGFFGNSPVHLTVSALTGVDLYYTYPFVAVGPGISIDPPGPFELGIAAHLGIVGFYPGVLPELSAGFVW